MSDLWTQFGTYTVASGQNIFVSSGFSEIGRGIATYIRDSDTTVRPDNEIRRADSNGVYFKLASSPVTPQMFGAIGDGVTDDKAAIIMAATSSVAIGVPLYIDAKYAFKSLIQMPAGIVIRGDWLDEACLLYNSATPGDGLEFIGAADIDGLVVDGGLTSTTDRKSRIMNTLVGFHGPMNSTDPDAYGSGVRIGRLRIKNSRTIAFLAVNLENLSIELLDLESINNTASIWTGLRSAQIGCIRVRDAGSLMGAAGVYNARSGQGVLIDAENTQLASWYPAGLISTENVYIRSTKNMQIGCVEIYQTTDTAFYINNDRSTGVSQIQIDAISIDTAAKDGFKVRSSGEPVVDVQVGSVLVRNVAQVGLGFESCQDITVKSAAVIMAGANSLFGFRGLPEDTKPINTQWTGTDYIRSIQATPYGLNIINCDRVYIAHIDISNVTASPISGYPAGYGLNMIGNCNVSVSGNIYNCQNYSMHDTANQICNIDLNIVSGPNSLLSSSPPQSYYYSVNDQGSYVDSATYSYGAIAISGAQTYRSLIASNKGNNPPSSPAAWTPINGDGDRNKIRLHGAYGSGGVSPFLARFNGTPNGLNVEAHCRPSDFARNLAGALGVTIYVPNLTQPAAPSPINSLMNASIKPVSVLDASIAMATGSSGNATLVIAHGLTAQPPSVDVALIPGTAGFTLNSLSATADATNVTINIAGTPNKTVQVRVRAEAVFPNGA